MADTRQVNFRLTEEHIAELTKRGGVKALRRWLATPEQRPAPHLFRAADVKRRPIVEDRTRCPECQALTRWQSEGRRRCTLCEWSGSA